MMQAADLEEFRATLEGAVAVDARAAGGDSHAGAAQAAGIQDHPVNSLGIEPLVGAEPNAVQREIDDHNVMIRPARSRLGREPGVAYE